MPTEGWVRSLLPRPFFATPQSLLAVYMEDWPRLLEITLHSEVGLWRQRQMPEISPTKVMGGEDEIPGGRFLQRGNRATPRSR